MNLIETIRNKARANVKTIVLPEGDEPRTVAAAATVVRAGLAKPILLGDPAKIRAVAAERGVDLAGVALVDPATSSAAFASVTPFALRSSKSVRA